MVYKLNWLYGFVVYIKTDDIYKDVAEDVNIRFDN